MLLEKIEGLLKEVSTVTAQSAEDVERLRLKYLSKKGEINALMGEFRNVAADQKRAVGIKINELKQLAQSRINALKEQVEDQAAQSDDIDLTRTPYPVTLGTRHPLTLVKNEIIDIFSRMGFTLYSGPEIDDDQHVFTMLNFAADHPARDMQDTFFIDRSDPSDVTKNVLLRSHTSGDEAHYMETHEPPIRILCPGRVYRNEAISARAHCFFHQVEGLYVDKGVSFTDLKQVLLTFAREMFGADTKIRLRPSYFPFTEPSAEMDISCNICGGKGCGFCKHRDGWRFWVAAWSIPTTWLPATSTPRSIRATLSDSVWSASPTSSIASATSVSSPRMTPASSASLSRRRRRVVLPAASHPAGSKIG